MAGTIMYIFGVITEYLVIWFDQVMVATSMRGIYLAAAFIFLLVRLILAPLFGATINAGASDTVKTWKENSRRKGSFEKGNKGKYLRK